jgi:hypothetical protein
MLSSTKNKGYKTNNEAHLVGALKDKIKDLRHENNCIREELQIIKQSIKYTAMHELETEVKTYSEECIRLRKKFVDCFQQSQSKENINEDDSEIQDKLSLALKINEGEKRNYKKLMESKTENLHIPKEASEPNKQKEEIMGLKHQVKNSSRSTELTDSKNAIKTLEMKTAEQIRLKDEEIQKLKEQIIKSNIIISIILVSNEEEKNISIYKKMPLISKEEATLISTELRILLIICHIPVKTLQEVKILKNVKYRICSIAANWMKQYLYMKLGKL